MNNTRLLSYITYKEQEKQKYLDLWNRISQLHTEIGLSQSTVDEIQAKTSSRIAQCEISIRDHQKLLK